MPTPPPVDGFAPEVQYATLHGHRRAYVKMGSGPAILLLHGLACDHTTWLPVMEKLAEKYTVIAPDFLGHGSSDKPRADYSLGGYANGMRDLLTILRIDKVTVVGHSFGGGVAMQFAYQFPERTERLMLVASGGLGREVTPFIRAVTLPFFHQTIGALTLPGIRHVACGALAAASRTGVPGTHDLGEIAVILDSWKDPRTRRAIRHLVRNVVDVHGQIVTMRDRAYLTEEMPMAVIWGADDQVLPAKHAYVAAELAPAAMVEVLEHSGHFPHKDHPERFVAFLDSFISSTEPAVYRRAQWRNVLARGAQKPVPEAQGGATPNLTVIA